MKKRGEFLFYSIVRFYYTWVDSETIRLTFVTGEAFDGAATLYPQPG